VQVWHDAYDVTSGVIQIYAPVGGGAIKDDIYLTLSYGSADIGRVNIYDGAINTPRQYPLGLPTGGWYWFSKDRQKTVSWFNNWQEDGIDSFVIYKNISYEFFGSIYPMCYAIAGSKLLKIVAEYSIGGWRIYLKIYSIHGDNINLLPDSTRLLSEDYYHINTQSFDGYDTGYFLTDTKYALLKMGNVTESGRSVYLVEFNADYSTNTMIKAFDGNPLSASTDRTNGSELLCHGDDIILAYDKNTGGSHYKQNLLFYDVTAKIFTKYDLIDCFSTGLTQLLYTSKALGITILQHATYEGGAVTAEGYPHKFEILVNTAVVFTSTEYYSVPLNFSSAANELRRNTQHDYAFDGRKLAVRFRLHFYKTSVDTDSNNRHWCIVIDTTKPSLTYEVLPVMPDTANEYNNLSVTHIPK
jgi:hypothetical protein